MGMTAAHRTTQEAWVGNRATEGPRCFYLFQKMIKTLKEKAAFSLIIHPSCARYTSYIESVAILKPPNSPVEYSPLYRCANQGPVNSLPKDTQLVNTKAKIQTQFRLQPPGLTD